MYNGACLQLSCAVVAMPSSHASTCQTILRTDRIISMTNSAVSGSDSAVSTLDAVQLIDQAQILWNSAPDALQL